MSTKTTTSKKAVFSAEYGNAVKYSDSVALGTADIDAADIIQLVYVPAGTAVDRVRIKTDDLDSGATPTLAAKIGFTPVDGSAPVSGADTAVSAAAAWGQAAGVLSYDVIPPYKVEVDSYLSVVITTGAATAAAGNAHAVVDGDSIGVK